MGSGCSSQGVPVGDPEHVAVALVEADPVRHAAVGAAAATGALASTAAGAAGESGAAVSVAVEESFVVLSMVRVLVKRGK